MSEPKILLLDEPSLVLGPPLVRVLFSDLRRLTGGGQSIVLVEQNAHQSVKHADHIYVLENGCITRAGTPAEMRQCTMISRSLDIISMLSGYS
jgi:branched-chain amino acid transport system ATP-binding protein